ncbi:hypothetical protein CsSME_00001371 [Camellia sinensis var. sinensis]
MYVIAFNSLTVTIQLLSVEDPWTLIIDDALANSFVTPATDDVKDDHRYHVIEEYERSWEQNEELGLNDIDTSSADAAYESTDATRKEGITESSCKNTWDDPSWTLE